MARCIRFKDTLQSATENRRIYTTFPTIVGFNILLCLIGIAGAVRLDKYWEKTLLTSLYTLLLLSASFNQGMLLTESQCGNCSLWRVVDMVCANTILVLNIYFFFHSLQLTDVILFVTAICFFGYSMFNEKTILLQTYKFCTNAWHFLLTCLIFNVTIFRFEQKNLF